MSERKVVGIHGHQPKESHDARPLPVAITKLRELYKSQLKSSFRKLFDNADDSLFAMADKAATNGDQTLYFDAMRELRLQKKHIANQCLKDVISGFNEIYQYQGNSSSPHDELLEWSLLENDELEVKVAIDSMCGRVESEAGRHLEELNQRILSIVPMDEILLNQLPVAARRICDSFVLACKDLDIGIRAKLIILKLFEKYVLCDYPALYSQSNALLIKHDILPNLTSSPSSSLKRKAPQLTNVNKNIEALSQNHESNNSFEPSVNKGVPTLGSCDFIESECGSQFEELRSLLHVNEQEETERKVDRDNVVFIQPSNIVELLSSEQQLNSRKSDRSDNQLINFNQLLSSKLLENNKQLKQVDTDIINLVSMLFEFILDDRQLQAEMKAIIGRLQIPILKVAILDKSFFDRGGHPARRLLNEIAAAAIGWNPSSKNKKDPLKEKITSVVENILSNFDSNISLFERLLKEFTDFTSREKKRGDLIEQRTKDSETGKALSESANSKVKEEIEIIVEDYKHFGRDLPDELCLFFNNEWSRVMSLYLLKHSEDSVQYKESVRFLSLLSDTVRPDKSALDARGGLLKSIPLVIKKMKQGLADAAFSSNQIKANTSEIEKLHVEALNSLQNYEEFAKSVMDDEAVADLIQDTLDIESEFNSFVSGTKKETIEKEADNVTIEVTDTLPNREANETLNTSSLGDLTDSKSAGAVEENAPEKTKKSSKNLAGDIDLEAFIKQVDHFSVGTWFEISKNGETERCKLAALIKSIDKYIFVNRSGVKVAEFKKDELAELLKNGLIQILNDGLLFDRALESVIGSLRTIN